MSKVGKPIELDAAVILGSGLSGAFGPDELETIGEIATGVAGHPGRLALWRRDGATVLVALGRRHLYEGIDVRETTGVVELAAERGARSIVVTNAAGGLDPRQRVGDVMLITGLNALLLGSRVPLLQSGAVPVATGRSTVRNDRNTDEHPTELFDRDRLGRILDGALARGVALREGVYAAVTGPSYETRAEIRMLRAMGAAAVGMSTVPELVAAWRMGLRATGISLITNTLSDTARQALDHADVVDAGARARQAMRIAIEAALDVD